MTVESRRLTPELSLISTGVRYCQPRFDGYLCWPPTAAGETTYLRCPVARLSDSTKNAYRRCGIDGLWNTKKFNETSEIGWTNYTPCFPMEIRNMLNELYEEDETGAQDKFNVALRTRYLEIFGFTLSFIALSISLYIFIHFRALRNHRTRIHKHLFGAMLVQVLIRLTVYIDQAVVRSSISSTDDNTTMTRGIDNMPYICEGSYVLLEYATSAMFLWMFMEGLYLHNVVAANNLRERVPYQWYCVWAWGAPVVITSIWTILTALKYRGEKVQTCWYGYNFTGIYWIVQGPRLIVILINFVFLLNILRVLIMKLSKSARREIVKVRKAVRAALVLLPLLGITNIMNMFEAPLSSDPIRFAVWSYLTHFLRSFQGFFIALIYCFLNGEVKQCLSKAYTNYMAERALLVRQNAICVPSMDEEPAKEKKASYLSCCFPSKTEKRTSKDYRACALDLNKDEEPAKEKKASCLSFCFPSKTEKRTSKDYRAGALDFNNTARARRLELHMVSNSQLPTPLQSPCPAVVRRQMELQELKQSTPLIPRRHIVSAPKRAVRIPFDDDDEAVTKEPFSCYADTLEMAELGAVSPWVYRRRCSPPEMGIFDTCSLTRGSCDEQSPVHIGGYIHATRVIVPSSPYVADTDAREVHFKVEQGHYRSENVVQFRNSLTLYRY
ncbi:neuropeptide receptor B2 isoform X3 [Bombyx mori]|uniref:neuropeptide receptor B2 isoform X3 n=1 Tax=Bombyx mori TaxID=7091 RepID=UPI002ED307C3